jgi:replicative DNA helicase
MSDLPRIADTSTLPTGFPSIDRALGGGWSPGELYVLGGDTGAGSSALALALALHQRDRALVLTSEMRPERVYERVLAMTARVSLDAIRLGSTDDEGQTRLAAAVLDLRDQTPAIALLDDHGVAGLGAQIDAVSDVGLVIVDGLEALIPNTVPVQGTREAIMALAVLALKRLALSKDVAVLLLSHLPLLDVQRGDCRPRLADFGADGAVGIHADVVFGLYREEMYSVHTGLPGETELLILKNRNGQVGYVDLFYHAEWMRFEEVFDA